MRVRALLGSGGYEARPRGTFQITPGQCASRRRNMLRPFCFQSKLVPMWPHARTHTRGYLFWVHGRCQAANDGHLELAVLVANYHLGCPTCMIKQLTKSYHGGGGDSILMFADSKLEVDLSQIPAGSRVEFFAVLCRSDGLLGQVITQHGQCALQQPREVCANMASANPTKLYLRKLCLALGFPPG